MSLIRSFVALGVLLLSVAMAAEPAQESFLLKQQAQPTAPSATSVTRIKPSPAAVASAVTAIDITAVSIDAPANPLAVPMYGTIELAVTIVTDVTGTQRFNPNPTTGGLDLQATFTGPGGSPVITRNGFYHGTSGKWLVRCAPTVIGAWTCSVTAKDPSSPTAGDTFSGVTFTCVTSTNPGFIRVSGSRLRFDDGSLFYGIGHNNGWQTDVELPSLADMSTNGENLLSFWISQPWPHADTNRKPIENITDGIGNYESTTCDYLDAVFARAEQNGVYLLPSIWSHDALRAATGHPWGAGNWSHNAYSNSSICATPLNFFVTTNGSNDSLAWTHQKNFFRYLTARYGHSTALVGWIGLVEMEGTSGYVSNATTVTTWCQKVRDWFIANDPYRVNSGSYPISFSKSDESSGNSANTLGATAGFPLHVADSYASKNSNSAIAATIATATRTMGGFGVVGGAPAFHTEFGAPVGLGASDPTHFHNAVWAGVSAGACLMPLKWCDAGSWPLFDDGTDYRDHTKYLSEFVNTTAVKTLMNNNAAVAATVTVPSGLGWGLKTADTGFAWLRLQPGNSIANTAATVTGCSTGHYLIDWLNPWTNASVSSTADITSGSTLTLTVPASITTADVAVRFYRERVNSAPVATPLTITNAYAGQAKSIALAATDVDDDTLTFATDVGPIHGILSATIGTPVTYTATAGYVGGDSFTYHANDGTVDSAIVTVNITVLVNLPPTANAQSVSVAQDTAIGITLTGSDPDIVPNATLSFFVTANPTHGSLSGSPPFLTYLPTTGYTGVDSFAFTVNDGALTSAAATVAITVIAGGVAPVPVGSTTSGGGCGLGGSAAAVLLGLMALLSCCSRLVRRRAD